MPLLGKLGREAAALRTRQEWLPEAVLGSSAFLDILGGFFEKTGTITEFPLSRSNFHTP